MNRLPPRSDAELFDKVARETPPGWFVGVLLVVGAIVGTFLYLLARMAWALTACVA